MKLQNVYVETMENNQNENRLLNYLGEELSLVLWVIAVFLLIIFSYMSNKNDFSKEREPNTYSKFSISEELQIKEDFNKLV